MKPNNYKEAIDQLTISNDFKERTAKIMRETRDSKRNDERTTNPFYRRKRMILTFASAALIIGASAFAMNQMNLTKTNNEVNESTQDSTILSAETDNDSNSTNITDIQLPADEASGSQLAEGEEVTGTEDAANSPISLILEPKSYPVGTKSLTLKIKNASDAEISYGVDFSIEQLIGGDAWGVVPATENLMFIEIAQLLQANSEADFVVDLSQLAPSLEEGTYRIVKNINGEVFYAEFELTK